MYKFKPPPPPLKKSPKRKNFFLQCFYHQSPHCHLTLVRKTITWTILLAELGNPYINFFSCKKKVFYAKQPSFVIFSKTVLAPNPSLNNPNFLEQRFLSKVTQTIYQGSTWKPRKAYKLKILFLTLSKQVKPWSFWYQKNIVFTYQKV